ncbi:MAG: TrkH family potassium uptake protein [Flavobacteriaceae bacterium]
MFHPKIIGYLMGVLLCFNGGFMLLSALASFCMQDQQTLALLMAAFTTMAIGGILLVSCRNNNRQLAKRDGYMVVSLGWLLMSLSGTLPYLFSGAIPSFTDAFFESMSGFTTTGATILKDIESIPAGILFWRSTTHWIGGMGIIVLALAILPLLGIGGMQLFTAEAPGPSSDKLHPRITDTAKRLWLIYVMFTTLNALLLWAGGMSLFDALNHAMSTLSTGGFSTKNLSLAHWNDFPWIQYITTFFMILAGSNFVLSYFAFTGQFDKIIRDDEFKTYVSFLGVFTALAFIYAVSTAIQADQSHFVDAEPWGYLESRFRHALFQVVAVVTTTGFSTADFTSWGGFLTLFFFGLMFLGGSAGSTSGGIKVVRHLLMIKNGFLEFKRALHPNAIIQVRYNNKTVDTDITYTILAFFILYMISFIIGALGFGALGLDFDSSAGLAASTLGNVGPALGAFGPSANYAALPLIGKFWATFLMLIGRLELFTVLILFSPFYWRKH